MNKIVLIGFRCVGKTTIGEKLAKILGWNFIDLDTEIQRKEKKTIKKMVEEKGWEYFRRLEKEEMKRLENLKNVVVALGGGSVYHQEELEALSKKSLVVWLYASTEVILKRIKEDEKTASQRPVLKNLDLEKEITEVLKERIPLYEKFSHIRIDTDKASPEEVVKKIFKKIEEVLK